MGPLGNHQIHRFQSATVATGATLELGSACSGAVSFSASTGTFKIDNASSFSSTLAGMSGQDTIEFADINYANVQIPTYSGDSQLARSQ